MGRKLLTRAAYAEHEPRAALLRKHCIDFVKKNMPTKTGYSLLSGGVDSHVCLFAALAAGKRPTVLSFTLKDRESRDFRCARNTAAHFGLDFEPIILDNSIDELKRHVWQVNHKYLKDVAINKSSIECTWPMYHALKHMRGPTHFLCGFGGDHPFGSSRKLKKMYYAGIDKFDADLKRYYSFQHHDLQLMFIDRVQEVHKKRVRPVMPLYDPAMYKIFTGMDPFKEGNKPINKAPMRLAFFEYFDQIQVYTQQSFQKGDTGIGESFEALINSDWNLKKFKSVVGIYNAVENREVSYKKS